MLSDLTKQIIKHFQKNFGAYLSLFLIVGFILLGTGNFLINTSAQNSPIWLFDTIASGGKFIIMAVVFKMLISSNSFAKIMEETMAKLFTELKFLETYNQEKLLTITEKSLSMYLNKKCPDLSIGHLMSSKISEILNNEKGYIKKFEIKIYDELNNKDKNIIKTTQTKTQTIYCPKNNFDINRYITVKQYSDIKKEEHLRYIEVLIDGKIIEPKITYTNIDGTINIDVEFPKLSQGYHEISETLEILDTECSHIMHFVKPCFSFKVSYKHSDDIINPVIIEKSGRSTPTRIDKALVVEQKDALMLTDEKIFILFEKKGGGCNV